MGNRERDADLGLATRGAGAAGASDDHVTTLGIYTTLGDCGVDGLSI